MNASIASITAATLMVLAPATGRSAEPGRPTEPPSLRAAALAAVTPLEDVLAIDTSLVETDADAGVVVLSETVQVVAADATSVTVLHRVFKPTTDAGIDAVSPFVLPYNRSYQHVDLVTARTVAADGTVTDIGADASFVQTPQHRAEQGIYTDSEELVVLFSNVKVGHLVEYVVVVEHREVRMPGAWSSVVFPRGYWPTARFRHRLEIEEPLAERLRTVEIGRPQVAAADIAGRPGWRAVEWRGDSLPALLWEAGRAPTAQHGPALRLTTVGSWDQVAEWYRGLLAPRSTLGPTLTAEVESWLAGTDDPMEILSLLHRHVADDVRYTGLEFGMGALQPRPPDEVWTSQYGDCKDKANLLRAMLGHAGIDARLVLLNTEHAGRVIADAPTYGQFNHAILAVEIDGETVLCDPTVAHLPAGELPPSDTGRDGLVIGPAGGELMPIASRPAGHVGFDFDLEVGADGTLQGWMEISADGSRGASYSHFFRYADASSRRAAFYTLLDRFFAGGELIDLELDRPDAGPSFVARGFFVVAGNRGPDGSGAVLRFPDGDVILPELDGDDGRQTPWHQSRETDAIQIRYRLPSGWSALSTLPHPLSVTSPASRAEASWTPDGGALVARLEVETMLELVSPDEFGRFRQIVTAVARWLDTPVTVGPVAGGTPVAGPAPVELRMMPTGQGQIRLVDRLYPVEGDRDRRRAALLQTRQMFPDDAETVFDTYVWLAQLDSLDGEPARAAERVEQAISIHGASQTRENLAWARYHLANHLADAGEVERALELFEAIAGDQAISDFRRAAASEMLGWLHADTDLERAIAALDAGLALDSGLEPELQDVRARLLVSSGHSERLAQQLGRELADDPDSAQTTVETLVGTVDDLIAEGDAAAAAALASAVLSVAADSPSLTVEEQRLARLESIADSAAAYRRIALAIGSYLADAAPDWLEGAADELPVSSSLSDFDEALSRFDGAGQLAPYVRCALERLARFEGSIPDFGGDLWQLAVVLELNRPEAGLLDRLIVWGRELPPSDEYFYEMIFIEQRQLERTGHRDDAAALLERWIEDVEVPVNFRVSFLAALGQIRERQERWDDALDCYRQLEADRDTNLIGYDALLRAALIDLDLGRFEEALRVIGLLSDLDDDSLVYCDNPEQIAELVVLAERPGLAARFWALEADWWPVWQTLERGLGLDPDPEVVVATVPSLQSALVDLQRAVSSEAPATFFDRFRVLVAAARWQPEMVFQVISLADDAKRMTDDHDALIQALVVALASGLDIGDDDYYKKSRVELATYYVDSGLYPQAVAVGREYLDRFEPDDDFGQGMMRLWGLAAAHSGIDGEIAAARLEKLLNDNELAGSRTVTVYVLDTLYRNLGRTGDEITLLEREIVSGAVDNEHYGEQLRRRHSELVADSNRESEFETVLEEWFDRFEPPWYDATGPATLDDDDARRVEGLIDDHPERLAETEIVKYRLLVARDPDRPIDDRERALIFACDDLEALATTDSEADELLEAVVSDRRLSKMNRSFLLWLALSRSRDAGHRDRILRWLESEIVDDLGADDRQRLSRLAETLPQPSSTPDELEEEARAIIRGTVVDHDVRKLRLLIARLLQLGAFDTAEELIGDLGGAVFDVGYETGGPALRLELGRELRAARAERPADEAMRAIVLEALDGDFFDPPAGFSDIRDHDQLDTLQRDHAFAIRLHLLATRRFESPSAGFWMELVNDLRDLHGQELARSVLETGVAAAADDDVRSRLLLYLSSNAFDIDDPADRDRLTGLLEAAASDPSMRLTRASASLIRQSMAARTGQSIDLNALEEAAAALGLEATTVRLRLLRAARMGTAELRREVESIPVDRLTHPVNMATVLPYLRASGLDDEAAVVADLARDESRRALLSSWSTRGGFWIRHVLRLCGALEEEACIEAAWRDFMMSDLSRRDLVLDVELTDAELRGDWRTARRAAAELVALRPKFYDLYWRLGRAEGRLGNRDAARRALAVFVEHCHDSVHHEDGLRLLAELDRR